MARDDWTYLPIQKTFNEQVKRAVERINKGKVRPKYASVRDFMVAAALDLLEKEGQLEEVKA